MTDQPTCDYMNAHWECGKPAIQEVWQPTQFWGDEELTLLKWHRCQEHRVEVKPIEAPND